jgi:hypothetical protein
MNLCLSGRIKLPTVNKQALRTRNINKFLSIPLSSCTIFTDCDNCSTLRHANGLEIKAVIAPILISKNKHDSPLPFVVTINKIKSPRRDLEDLLAIIENDAAYECLRHVTDCKPDCNIAKPFIGRATEHNQDSLDDASKAQVNCISTTSGVITATLDDAAESHDNLPKVYAKMDSKIDITTCDTENTSIISVSSCKGNRRADFLVS